MEEALRVEGGKRGLDQSLYWNKGDGLQPRNPRINPNVYKWDVLKTEQRYAMYNTGSITSLIL